MAISFKNAEKPSPIVVVKEGNKVDVKNPDTGAWEGAAVTEK